MEWFYVKGGKRLLRLRVVNPLANQSQFSLHTFEKPSYRNRFSSVVFPETVAGLVSPKQLVTQQKRFRGKINIQKPQKLFYERALVTKFVTPYYVRKTPLKPMWEACTRVNPPRKENDEIHQYQRIIARECLQRFESSKMVAFLHKNPMTAQESFDFAVALHKHGMSVKYYGRKTIAHGINGTRFEAILPLFCAPGLIVFAAEPTFKELQKVVKKTPMVTIMAGILEGKLLNVNDFQKYGNASITDTRSELVQTLQTASGVHLNRQLNWHQSTLVSRLEQIGKNVETDVGKETENEETTKEEIETK